jgi:hypothetical protein
MMEAACTSETSVDIQLRARQYIPEDSELCTELIYSRSVTRRTSSQTVVQESHLIPSVIARASESSVVPILIRFGSTAASRSSTFPAPSVSYWQITRL